MKDYTNLLESDPAAVFDRVNPQLVVAVDDHDNETGILDKIEAHRHGGTLHRAFSIFLFDSSNRILLQRRAPTKYHFGGLWTNTCCGHAIPGEDLAITATVRLWQEMGLCVQLCELAVFTYVASDAVSGLTEREIDHIFVGECNRDPSPDPGEVGAWRWIDYEALERELAVAPELFTPWFCLGLNALRQNRQYCN